MIKETAKVVAVDIQGRGLWVEGIQRSTCGACAARMGCGHRLLGQRKTPTIKAAIAPEDRFNYQAGQSVEVGIREDLIVKASLLLYLLPLGGLLLAAALANAWPGKEWLTICAGAAGLLGGALLVRRLSARLSCDNSLHAQVLGWLDDQTLTLNLEPGSDDPALKALD